MSDHTNRRQFLAVASSTTVAALAGCIGGDDDDSGDGEENGEENGMENGDENGMENGDENGMENGEENGMENGEENGMENGEENGMENGEENGMENGEENGMENGEENGMENGPVTFTVRIENVAPTNFYGSETPTGGAVWITPGAFAVHTGGSPIFAEGEEASIGLEGLAEAGPPTGFPDEPGLIDELQGMVGDMGVVSAGAYTPENTVADPNDPMGEVPGAPPIAPGGAFEFEVEAEPGQRLSFASMFVPSNDLFFAPEPDGIALWPEDGDPVDGDVTDSVNLWDAGTELNAAPPGQGPDQAPAQDAPTQGEAEEGVVRRLDDVDDGHDYPAVSDAIQVVVSHGDM